MEQLNVDKIIEALELLLSPQADPYPYNSTEKEVKEIPQNLNLMCDCLEALNQQKAQITMLEHSTMAAVKDFIKYFIDVFLPEQYAGTDEDYIIGETAFNLGIAFTKWQKFLEEQYEQFIFTQ